MKNKKRTQLIGTLSKPKKVKQLQAYFLQGGKWRKVGKILGGN